MSYKTLEKVHIIRNRLKTAYSRQKSYAYHNRRELEFEEGDKVYLKFSPMQGVVRFCKKGKLSPLYVGPYEILQRVVKVVNELKFLSELASVHPVSMFPCIKSVTVSMILFFLLRVFVSSINSPMRKFRFKFLIGKSRSEEIKRLFP